MAKRIAILLLLSVFGLAARPAQGPELHRVMREKLDHMQKILEALVTSDWKALETQTGELERLTQDPRWLVLNFKEYVRQSDAFKGELADLRAAVAHRDLEETPRAYVVVTLGCVACHRYLARARIASPIPALPGAGSLTPIKP